MDCTRSEKRESKHPKSIDVLTILVYMHGNHLCEARHSLLPRLLFRRLTPICTTWGCYTGGSHRASHTRHAYYTSVIYRRRRSALETIRICDCPDAAVLLVEQDECMEEVYEDNLIMTRCVAWVFPAPPFVRPTLIIALRCYD